MFLKLFLGVILSINVAFADGNIKTLLQNDPQVKRFIGSITNYVPLTDGLSGAEVYLLDNKFVLKRFKVYNPATISIQQKAAKRGIAPKILYRNSKQRFVIMEFVGDSFLPRDHQTIEKLVQFVKTLHQIKPTKDIPHKDPFNRLANIVESLKASNLSEELLNKFTIVLSLERNHNSDAVVSHNDLNPNNILFIKGKINIVDWDSAGLADPYYDLSTLALWYMDIPKVQSKLLEGYLERKPTQNELNYLNVMKKVTIAIYAGRLIQVAAEMGCETQPPIPKENLSEFLAKIGSGEIKLNSGRVLYQFGLVLLKEI